MQRRSITTLLVMLPVPGEEEMTVARVVTKTIAETGIERRAGGGAAAVTVATADEAARGAIAKIPRQGAEVTVEGAINARAPDVETTAVMIVMAAVAEKRAAIAAVTTMTAAILMTAAEKGKAKRAGRTAGVGTAGVIAAIPTQVTATKSTDVVSGF
jgi:hypothetical protein